MFYDNAMTSYALGCIQFPHLHFMYVSFKHGIIRFPNMVRKRPHVHVGVLVLREDRLRRMPLASPLDSPLCTLAHCAQSGNRALSPFVGVTMATESFIPEN